MLTHVEDLPPLAQRQERRSLPLLTSATSIDSWDFTTTVHSSRTINRPRFTCDHEDSTDNAVFVMDEEDKQIVTHTADTEESDVGIDAGPSSATTSASSLRSFGLDDNPCPSTPSSYIDASEMACEARNIGESLTSIAEHANQHPAATSRQPPTSRKDRSIPVATSLSDLSSSSDHRRNLWQRLKTNVRRSSSSDSRPRDPSPSKSKMSGLVSASKGRLTGNSTPNWQFVELMYIYNWCCLLLWYSWSVLNKFLLLLYYKGTRFNYSAIRMWCDHVGFHQWKRSHSPPCNICRPILRRGPPLSSFPLVRTICLSTSWK